MFTKLQNKTSVVFVNQVYVHICILYNYIKCIYKFKGKNIRKMDILYMEYRHIHDDVYVHKLWIVNANIRQGVHRQLWFCTYMYTHKMYTQVQGEEHQQKD